MNTYFNLGCLRCPNLDRDKTGRCIPKRGAPCKVSEIVTEETNTIISVVSDFKSFCKMVQDNRPNCPIADRIVITRIAENSADACRICRDIWLRVHLNDFPKDAGSSEKTNKQLSYLGAEAALFT